MKTSFLTILAIMISLSLFSCGEEHKNDSPYYTPQNYNGIENELKNAEFFCANKGSCPQNVGMIFLNLDGSDYQPKIAQCTGFLISEDIVATNSHCIPDHLKSSSSKCDSQMAIRFIDSSEHQKNIFKCQEILSYSLKENIVEPDYAFFRIEKTGRKPVAIHKNGLKDNDPIYTVKVTPLRSARGGRLESENCKTVLGTLLNIKGTNSWSKTAVGLGCKGIPGNSGSPVFNSAGDVIGILYGLMTDQYNRDLESIFKQFKLNLPSNITPHILFTSLSCIEDPVTRTLNKEKCSYGETVSLTDCMDLEGGNTESRLIHLVERWRKDLPSIFVYDFITQEQPIQFEAQPVCVKPQNKYDRYNDFVTLDGIWGFRQEHLNLIYPKALVIGSTMTADDEYRMKLEFKEMFRLRYKVDLVKEGAQWAGTMTSTHSFWDTYSFWNIDLTSLKIPISLPECSDQQMSSPPTEWVRLENGELITQQEYQKRQKPKEKKICER